LCLFLAQVTFTLVSHSLIFIGRHISNLLIIAYNRFGTPAPAVTSVTAGVQRPNPLYANAAAAVPHPPPTRVAVFAWLVSGNNVLITTRGPGSSNPEYRGTTSGVGGKVDIGENPVDALRREVEEEVGIIIPDDCHIVPSYTEPTDDGLQSVSWYVVRLNDEPVPNVPDSEITKIIDPEWVPYTDVDQDQMATSTRHAFRASLPFLHSGFESRDIGRHVSKWLRRPETQFPEGFDLVLVNNKNRICVAYVVHLLTGKEIDFADAEANLGPDDAYSLYQFVDDPADWAIFDSSSGRWVRGDPDTAKYHAMWSQNGPHGHMDGLRRSTDPIARTDTVHYLQGRAPLSFLPADLPPAVQAYVDAAVAKVHASDIQIRMDTATDAIYKYTSLSLDDQARWVALCETFSPTVPADLKASTAGPQDTPEPEDEPTDDTPPPRTDKGKGRASEQQDHEWTPPPYERHGPLAVWPDAHAAATARAAVGPSNGNTAVVTSSMPAFAFHSSTDIATAVRPRRVWPVSFKDDRDTFTEIEMDIAATYGPTLRGARNMADLFLTGTMNPHNNVTTNPAVQSTRISTRLEDRGSWLENVERISHLSGTTRHDENLQPNLTPLNRQENIMMLSREVETTYADILEDRRVASSIARNLLRLTDAPGASFMPWYERLWAGYFTATLGGTLRIAGTRRLAPAHVGLYAGPIDAWWRALCPAQEGVSELFGVQILAGAPPAPRPPTANFPRFESVQGLSTCTLMPGRRYLNDEVPPISLANNRDFRVVLAHFTGEYLDMDSPPQFLAPGAARTVQNHPLTCSHLSPYSATLPPLVFLSNEPGAMWNAVNHNAAAYANPQSWLDAISFLLRGYGQIEDCMTGYASHLRRSAQFFPHYTRHLPCPIGSRFLTGHAILTALRRRLVYMRVIRCELDQFPAPVLGVAHFRDNADEAMWPAIWNATAPAGTPLDRANLVGAAGAPGLAICTAVFGGPITAVNLPAAIVNFNANVPVYCQRDIQWHAYFVNTEISGTDTDPLFDMVTTMPDAVFNNMRAWLNEPFVVGNWATQPTGAPSVAMLNGLADWHVPYRTIPGRPVPANLQNAFIDGFEDDVTMQLPMHNMEETFCIRVPSGLCYLDDRVHNQAEYHADVDALLLADRLIRHIDVNRPFNMGVLLQLQSRCAIDAVTTAMQLTPARIFAHTNVLSTGNIDYDALLMRKAEYPDLGDTEQFQKAYFSGIVHALQSNGLPDTLAGEASLGSMYRMINPNRWRYPMANGIIDYDCVSTYLTVTAPITRSIFRPDINVPGGIITKRPVLLTPASEDNELLWDSWDIDTSSLSKLGPHGTLRCVAALNGYRILFEPANRYMRTTGNSDPIAYPVLTHFGRVGPRYPSSFPHAITLMQEPLWHFAPLKNAALRVPVDANGYNYVKAAPLHGMMALPRAGLLPPTAPYLPNTIAELVGNNANRRPQQAYTGANWGYAANGYLKADHLIYGGMYYTNPANQLLDNTGTETAELRTVIPWFSRQASTNPVVMRSWRSYTSFSNYQRALHAPGRALTGPNGNPLPAGYGRAGNAGMQPTGSSALIFAPPMPDTIAPADVLIHFSMNTSVLLQRWETWYFKPHAEYVPLCISNVDEVAGNLQPRGISTTYNARTAGFLEAVRTVPDSTPLLGLNERVNAVRIPGWTDAQSADVTIAPPEAVAPSTRRDLLHLTSGHSATTHVHATKQAIEQERLLIIQPPPTDPTPPADPTTGNSPFQWPRRNTSTRLNQPTQKARAPLLVISKPKMPSFY
jgi:8-oxo-dGTP pyrophosphatase MutT (NUDIX family)